MIIVNTDYVPGHQVVECLGMARGNTIRCTNFVRDWFAGLKQIVGGEIESYTRMISEAREQALSRLVEAAQSVGANAIVNVRFTTSSVMSNACEILAYGTAVKVVPDNAG